MKAGSEQDLGEIAHSLAMNQMNDIGNLTEF